MVIQAAGTQVAAQLNKVSHQELANGMSQYLLGPYLCYEHTPFFRRKRSDWDYYFQSNQNNSGKWQARCTLFLSLKIDWWGATSGGTSKCSTFNSKQGSCARLEGGNRKKQIMRLALHNDHCSESASSWCYYEITTMQKKPYFPAYYELRQAT